MQSKTNWSSHMKSDTYIDSRDVLDNFGMIVAASIFAPTSDALAAETKVYSSNARNMGRLNSGDSSGYSITTQRHQKLVLSSRRAMVGCKNSSARSLAGESIGKEKLSEKDCNLMVMSGESDFMLGALTELDCPTCPYGIGSR